MELINFSTREFLCAMHCKQCGFLNSKAARIALVTSLRRLKA